MAAVTVVALLAVSCGNQESGMKVQGTNVPSATKQSIADKIPIVGVANYGAHPILDVIVVAFKTRMKERGFEDGKNVKFLWESVEGDMNLAPSVA